MNDPTTKKNQSLEAYQGGRLRIVFVLTLLFFFAQFAGAIRAKSSVLKLDAVHLLMDILALGASLVAVSVAARKPTARYNFGFYRAEPLAALFNATLVLFAVFEIVREGIEKWSNREPPVAGWMLVVSLGALVVNGISAYLLHEAIHHTEHGTFGGHHHHDHSGHGHHHEHGTPTDDRHPHHDADVSHEMGHALNLRSARLHLVGDFLGSNRRRSSQR